jgi:hypothetical protein
MTIKQELVEGLSNVIEGQESYRGLREVSRSESPSSRVSGVEDFDGLLSFTPHSLTYH